MVQASQSGDRRANDRQKRVERQRDERRARSDAANERERQEESEEGQARDRLRDVRQKQERAADRGPARGENPAGRPSAVAMTVETITSTRCCRTSCNSSPAWACQN